MAAADPLKAQDFSRSSRASTGGVGSGPVFESVSLISRFRPLTDRQLTQTQTGATKRAHIPFSVCRTISPCSSKGNESAQKLDSHLQIYISLKSLASTIQILTGRSSWVRIDDTLSSWMGPYSRGADSGQQPTSMNGLRACEYWIPESK